MPSVAVRLPKFVVLRRRADGTHRALFAVPARLRPEGWPATIPTPPQCQRTGRLDAAELRAIADHVEGRGGLLDQLAAARDLHRPPAAPTHGGMQHAWQIWQEGEAWAALKPRTRDFYRKTMALLLRWSTAAGHPPLDTITTPSLLGYLAAFDDRPAQKGHLRRTFSALMGVARNHGLIRESHPLAPRLRVRLKSARKRALQLWSRADVAAYAAAAHLMGWPGGARLLQLMWETSADASDVVTWRRGEHFADGPEPAISYQRGKSGAGAQPLWTPISAGLAADIRASGDLYLVVGRNGRPYTADSVRDDNRRGRDFGALQRRVVEEGGPRLLMDHLRHSAATDAVDVGATFEATRSLTGHSSTAMLEQVYVQLTRAQARAIQRARKIID